MQAIYFFFYYFLLYYYYSPYSSTQLNSTATLERSNTNKERSVTSMAAVRVHDAEDSRKRVHSSICWHTDMLSTLKAAQGTHARKTNLRHDLQIRQRLLVSLSMKKKLKSQPPNWSQRDAAT